MTDALAARATAIAPSGVEIVAATAAFGPRLLSRRRDVAVGATAVLAALAEHADGIDAAVIGSFSDPGLEAAREVSAVPVTALCEASVHLACQLGARIGLVLGSRRMIPVLEERLRSYGLRDRVAAIDTPPEDARPRTKEEAIEVFAAIGAALVERAGIEVLVLGGGALIGVAATIEARLPVPVVDSVDCAVLQAYALARLGAKKATIGSLSHPAAVPATGLQPGLARLFDVGG